MVVAEMSPFVFEGPVPPDDLVGREEILAALWSRAVGGRFVLLLAPRRYGKTSVIHRLRHDARTTRELDVVLIDLLGVQTVADVVARFRSAFADIDDGPLRRSVDRVFRYLPEIGAGAGPLTVTARRIEDAEGATRSLEELLRVPDRVASRSGRRMLVVLDEFQAVASVPPVDAVIRSVVQHQRDHVSYLFAGSEQSLLDSLFSVRAAPLYGQAERITLPPLAAESLGTFIDAKCADTGRTVETAAMASLLALADGHPQRAMLLAHHLWECTPAEGCADLAALGVAAEAALGHTEPEFAAVVAVLSDAQRKVLRLAAWREPFFGAAARRLRLTKGGTQAAEKALVKVGLIARTPRRTLVDPLLGEWLRRRNPRP